MTQPSKDQWLPIASAPLTHPVLLWWRTCKYPHVGQYTSDETGEGWRCDGDECVPRNQKDCTHWMPLPEPPR